MDISTDFTYTSHCPPQISESQGYIAYVNGDRLVVRSSTTLATKRIINLSPGFGRRVASIRWDKCVGESSEQRLALASNDEVLVYSIDQYGGPAEEPSTSTSSKLQQLPQQAGCTILPGKEGVADVEWKSCRYQIKNGSISSSSNDSQIIRLVVFSRHALRITVWSSDGLELDLGTPKLSRCLVRPTDSRDISVLTRQSTSDIVRTVNLEDLAISRDANMVKEVKLNGIVDAKEVKWSPTGLFLAASETPAMGYKVCIYGAEGTLLNFFTNKDADCGVTSLQWAKSILPQNENRRQSEEVLLIGSQDERVVALSMFNYRPRVELVHGSTIQDEVPVWIEGESNTEDHLVYELARMPFHPPQFSQKTPQSMSSDFVPGVDMIQLSPDGALMATKVSSMPSTVWLWSVEGFKQDADVVLVAVFCHSSVIRSIHWSKDGSSMLVVPSEGALVGVWNRYSSKRPYLMDWSGTFNAVHGASWALQDEQSNIQRVMAWDNRSLAMATLDVDSVLGVQLSSQNLDQIARYEDDIEARRHGSPQLLQDDDTMVRDIVNGVQQNEWCEDPENIKLEDTFHGMSIKS